MRQFGNGQKLRLAAYPLLTLAVALASGYGLWRAAQQPLSYEDEPVVSAATATPPLILQAGSRLTQSFISSGGNLAGLTLTSPAQTTKRGQLKITVRDEHGQVLATAYEGPTRYRDTKAILQYELPNVATAVAAPLILTVSHVGAHPVSLVVNDEPSYPDGTLYLDGQPQSADLAFTLRRPAPLPETARDGVVAGLALLYGGVLLMILRQGQWLTASFLLIILVPTALAGYWYSPGTLGISDWDYYLSTYEHYRRTIISHHQLPLWNPYTCGGTAGLADPEFALFSFFTPMLLLFGLPDGLRVSLYVSAVMLAVGTLVLSRRLHFSAPAAYVAAIVLPLSSTVGLKLVEGHLQHLAAVWIPWILVSWLAAYRKRLLRPNRAALLCGIFLALMFYQGGIYLLFYLVPGLLLVSVLTAHPVHALAVTAQAGLWSFGFSALKLFPVLLWIRAFPDEVYHTSPNFLPYLYDIFLGRHLHGAQVLPQQGGGWHEYGAYIGVTILALALVGTSQMGRRRTIRALVVGSLVATLLASSGPLLQPAFNVLAWLPRSNVSRAFLYAVLALALLAGAGYDVVRKRLSWQSRALLLPLLLALAAVELASVAYPLSLRAFILPPVVPSLQSLDGPPLFRDEYYSYRTGGEEYTRAYALARAGYGSLSYCSVLGPRPAVILEKNLTTQPYIFTSPQAVARLVHWSPNKIAININADQTTTVQINTNFAPGWIVQTSGTAAAAQNHRGLVGATIGPGQHDVIFQYRPPGLMTGMLVTAAAIVIAASKVRHRLTASPRKKPTLARIHPRAAHTIARGEIPSGAGEL